MIIIKLLSPCDLSLLSFTLSGKLSMLRNKEVLSRINDLSTKGPEEPFGSENWTVIKSTSDLKLQKEGNDLNTYFAHHTRDGGPDLI